MANPSYQLDLVIELPSPYIPVESRLPPLWTPSIRRAQDDFGITFGSSGNGGVFLGISVGTRTPTIAGVPKLPSNYRNLLRIDYWMYGPDNNYGFIPHFHAGDLKDHFLLPRV